MPTLDKSVTSTLRLYAISEHDSIDLQTLINIADHYNMLEDTTIISIISEFLT